MSQPVALVTGGSSGIGLAAAEALAAAGVRVYVVSRRPFSHPSLTHLCADVSDESAVRAAVESVLSEAGQLDILVNCAGMGISGAVEFTELAEAKRQFDVNFFGMVNVTRAVLPHMRARGAGRIVNVSSVAAVVPIPFQTYYSASKAAINSYTQALANEVRPYGVSVTAVMPGDIRTGFTDARAKSAAGDEAYGGRIARSVEKMEHDERTGMDPAAAGAFVARIALKKHVKPLYAIGLAYKAAAFAAQILPCGPKNRLIGQLYAK